MNTQFLPPGQLETPVLFLVFNRPDTTARVFEAIRHAKPPRLYIAADGPRESHEGEAEEVEKVREIVTMVDWPCQVRTLFQEKNLGCKYAVSSGINWFFEMEEQGIILEDDCLPSQSFFWFCEDLLNRFADDFRVAQICGFNATSCAVEDSDYFFSHRGSVWGWATWRRCWRNFDINMTAWPYVKRNDGLMGSYIIQSLKEERYLAYDATFKNKIDTWDYQWAFARSINNQMCVFPRISLIRNIGFSENATHTREVPDWLRLVSIGEISIPMSNLPIGFIPSWRYELAIAEHHSTSIIRRFLKKIFRLLRKVFLNE
jgi:hypothetical protein